MNIVQFQVTQGALYVLDAAGVLWRNELGSEGPVSPAKWHAIAVPTARQHAVHNEQERYNIDHQEVGS